MDTPKAKTERDYQRELRELMLGSYVGLDDMSNNDKDRYILKLEEKLTLVKKMLGC